MNELVIKGRTELLPYRELNERKVFAYADIAEGLQVDPAIVRRQYTRNAEAWSPDETGVGHFDTPSGAQEIRWFTARGAMRFCRYVKSGRSDALFNHLLDLWESERASATPAPISSADMAKTLQAFMQASLARTIEINQELNTIDTRINAVEERQKQVDPQEIESRMFVLHKLKKVLVDGTKGTSQPVTNQGYWRAIKEHVKIASFQNRAALTVELMDRAVEYARNWCFSRGVQPPSLFDQAAANDRPA